MNADEQIVELAGSQVLIHRERPGWFWRGANWTSHMKSRGAFSTLEEAIENARICLMAAGGSDSGGEPTER